MVIPVSAEVAATIAKMRGKLEAADVATTISSHPQPGQRHAVTEEQATKAFELGRAEEVRAGLGVDPDPAMVKEAVRVLLGVAAGTDLPEGTVTEYVKAFKKAMKIADPAPAVPATVPATAPAADEDEDENKPKSRVLVGFLGFIGFALIVLFSAQMNPPMLQRVIAYVIVPAVTVLICVVAWMRRRPMRFLILAMIAAFLVLVWGNIQREMPNLAPGVADLTKTPDTATKAPPTKAAPPVVPGAVTAAERDLHRKDAPAHLKALQDLWEGPDDNPVATLPKKLRERLDTANSNSGLAIGSDQALTDRYRVLGNTSFGYEATKARDLYKAAKEFVEKKLDIALTDPPTYTRTEWERAVYSPALAAMEKQKVLATALAEVDRLEADAKKVKAAADARKVEDLLKEQRKAEADAAQKKRDDDRAKGVALLRKQWKLVDDETARTKYMGDSARQPGTENLRAWNWNAIGLILVDYRQADIWIKAELDPSYWDPTLKRMTQKELDAAYDAYNKAFMDDYGREAGFKSVGDFRRVFFLKNPQWSILKAEFARHQKVVTGASVDRVPAKYREPYYSRFSPPVGKLARDLRNLKHPRPEKDGEELVGLTETEWLKLNGN